jgi:hypothetical protein
LTDQFSFGVSLYEAIYGHRPFRGKGTDELQEEMKRGIEEPDGVRVSARLRKVMRRATAYDRAARYPSMDELLDDLRRDTRKTRTSIALGGGAVLIAAIAGLGAMRMRDHRDPCEGGEARLTGVWDPQLRLAIDLAFRATGVPFAAETSQRIRDILDGYTRSALDMQRKSCLATTVRHEQSSEVLDLRSACLDRRWEALAALTRELAAAHSAEAVVAAVQAARALPSIEPCGDETVLRQAYPAPSTTEQAHAVAESARSSTKAARAFLRRSRERRRGGQTRGRARAQSRVSANARRGAVRPGAEHALGRQRRRGDGDMAGRDRRRFRSPRPSPRRGGVDAADVRYGR